MKSNFQDCVLLFSSNNVSTKQESNSIIKISLMNKFHLCYNSEKRVDKKTCNAPWRALDPRCILLFLMIYIFGLFFSTFNIVNMLLFQHSFNIPIQFAFHFRSNYRFVCVPISVPFRFSC
jgi:hypothetical protein